MRMSVACTFEPGLIGRLAEVPEVYEVYGKLQSDCIGGGRASYTLRKITRKTLERSVAEAHSRNIGFNYLINGATLNGAEQTRRGQRSVRKLLDYVDRIGVDAVTLASPYLLNLVKKNYPRLKTRASAFASIDSPLKAKQWQDMGADTVCISAVACNRDFKKLEKIRAAVTCDLQLIANANCLPACAYELTHMNMLTQSSRSGDRLGGFCLDYCVLHCSSRRLSEPLNFLRAVWIRPEDLALYEDLGYDNFKIVERSCPGDLLVKRVRAYENRRFDGNLLELVGQVAQIKKEQDAPLGVRFGMIRRFLRPDFVRLSSVIKLKQYAEQIILHDFSKETSPVYIDNRMLDGFLPEFRLRECDQTGCGSCGCCSTWEKKAVRIDESYRTSVLARAADLEKGIYSGSLW